MESVGKLQSARWSTFVCLGGLIVLSAVGCLTIEVDIPLPLPASSETVPEEVAGDQEEDRSDMGVEGEVLIDFETFPDGEPIEIDEAFGSAVLTTDQFEPWGATFSSYGDTRSPTIFPNYYDVPSTGNRLNDGAGGNGNRYAIFLDLRMPAVSVSADVGTATGRSCTVLAFDANGNQVATATGAAPTDGYSQYAGNLQVAVDEPTTIRQVQFWSDDEAVGIGIDNLRIVFSNQATDQPSLDGQARAASQSVDGHLVPGPLTELLEEHQGDLENISSICQSFSWPLYCWKKASQLNPEIRDGICDGLRQDLLEDEEIREFVDGHNLDCRHGIPQFIY